MSENQTEIDIDTQTQIIASELKIGPSDEVFRYLHPVMICGIEDGQLLIRGTRSNGTRVVDSYSSTPNSRQSVRSLDNPGLNFTRDFHSHYKGDNTRMAVSLKMKDQPQGIRIYKDLGSEMPSVYFTLPKESFFRVDLKEGDKTEVGLAIQLHRMMEDLSVKEEPRYYNWTDSGNGERVVMYVHDVDKEEQIEVVFSKSDDSYRISTSHTNQNKKGIELLAINRLLIDNRDFDTVVGEDGTIYRKDDLVNEVMQMPELKSLADQ